jgi:hypothetical protein
MSDEEGQLKQLLASVEAQMIVDVLTQNLLGLRTQVDGVLDAAKESSSASTDHQYLSDDGRERVHRGRRNHG